jgi:hypothetical protein
LCRARIDVLGDGPLAVFRRSIPRDCSIDKARKCGYMLQVPGDHKEAQILNACWKIIPMVMERTAQAKYAEPKAAA